MRLRLFDRIRRLARRGADRRGPGHDGSRHAGHDLLAFSSPQDSRGPLGHQQDHAGPAASGERSGAREPRLAGRDATGRHRRKGPADSVPHGGGTAAGPHRDGTAAGRDGGGTAAGPHRDGTGGGAGGDGLRGGSGRPAARGGPAGGGAGRARVREAPYGAAPASATDGRADAGHPPAETQARKPWYQSVPGAPAERPAPAPSRMPGAMAVMRAAHRAHGARLPRAEPHAQAQRPTADGRRNCGALEAVLWRQWDPSVPPPPEIITAVDRLAEFPRQIKEKLAAGLDGIYVGPGGVPELDDMSGLRGVPLPSGRASWDACAGAYGERKIVVGSRPSPTPDVLCHEVGHALDDLDSPPGKWQSDSAEFRMLYDRCQPRLASDFHRQPGGLGRKEFFADAFAAIASGQRPALVDMLGGDTRTALRVMLYFNRRYGI